VVTISTDDALLDVDLIHRWLSEDAYWALGRSREAVERSLRESVNVGAYDEGADGPVQVGFLRIVTDRATFAWVCDLYVDPAARGRRVGKLLMAEADRLLGDYGVRRAMLATADAHGLYAQYGYAPLADPGRWMERGY
jgi:GNAT superfamily N-acetyltransferase